MQIKSFSLSTIAGLTLGILLIGYSAFAIWAPPSGSPPNGNTSAPLNTGSSDQTKTGGTLTLQGDLISQNKTIKGDDIILGKQLGNGTITTDGDIVIYNSQAQEKVEFHAGNPVVAIFKGIASLFDNSNNPTIVFDPQVKTIDVGSVTIQGNRSISTGLNSDKLDDLDAAELMAAGGGGGWSVIHPWIDKKLVSNATAGGPRLLGTITPDNIGWLATVRQMTIVVTNQEEANGPVCWVKIIYDSGVPQISDKVTAPAGPVSSSQKHVIDLKSLPSEFTRDGISKLELWGSVATNQDAGVCALAIDTGYEYQP